MALYSGRILVRKGNEDDFDPDKMMPGEWALSTDKKIVRICVAAGMCIRMATYDAFEEDVAKVEGILKTCQTIQEAVVRINAEVSQNADAVAEYTAQAKNYMESAKTSETNAKTSETNAKESEVNAKSSETNAKLSEETAQAVFESLPEDYSTLSKEFYEIAIKQTSSGEEIHVDDSANAKVREFALFGKAKQNTTSGKNLFDISTDGSQCIGNYYVNNWNNNFGITENADYFSYRIKVESGKKYIWSTTADSMYRNIRFENANKELIKDSSIDWRNMKNNPFTIPDQVEYMVFHMNADSVINLKYQLELGDTVTPWEPYTNGPSPNPQYPQDTEVATNPGVKSRGKNIFNFNKLTSKKEGGVTFTPIFDSNGYLQYIELDGLSTKNVSYNVINSLLPVEPYVGYILNGTPEGSSHTKYCSFICKYNEEERWQEEVYDTGNGCKVTNSHSKFNAGILVRSGVTLNKVKFYPMLSKEGGEYQPYKETTATIQGEYAGIPVSEGGNYTDQSGQQWICDEVVKYADGSGERIQRIKKKRISYKSWSKTGTLADRYYTSFASVLPEIDEVFYKNIMCSHFFYDETGTSETVGSFITNKGNIGFVFAEKGTSSVSDFNTFLSENDVYAMYILKEPIRTPLTAEEIAEIEKLQTFYPVTNVLNDGDCGMNVTYLADSKLYIDNRLAQIEQALIANI